MSPLRRTTKSAQELRDRLLALADRAGLAQRSAGMTADQFHRFASTGQNPGGRLRNGSSGPPDGVVG